MFIFLIKTIYSIKKSIKIITISHKTDPVTKELGLLKEPFILIL